MSSRLTIRTRVALWYGAVIVAVLLVVGVAVSVVYERIGLSRIDAEIEAAARTLDGVIAHELSEELTLPRAALGAVAELELPGTGVAILARSGDVLATRVSGVGELPSGQLRVEHAGDPAHTLAMMGLRVVASDWHHADAAYTIVAWTSLAPLERERAILQNTMRASIPLAALAAMLGGWLIGRWALRPLTAMATAVGTIDHHRLEGRLAWTGADDEIGRLATAFNAVLDRLTTVVHAQRRFMADASHEMRTPVSIAQTAAQVTLSTSHRTEDEYRDSLAIIDTQMRRLTHVVGDMFMLALADLDARPLEPADLYLNELVADCARAARVLASTRDVAIEVEGDVVDLQMRGDEGLLKQLVMNLLDNAVRHVPGDGRIRVTLQRHDGTAELTVEDSGPGIPVADQARVFERFVRLGSPRTGGGAGLGLAIAHWIAEQHGGSLRVGGTGEASSRFVVTLPLEPAPAVPS